MPFFSLLNLGCITAGSYFVRAISLVYSFLTQSKLPRYLHKPGPSWAFLTGATSGLGLSLASDLCSRGFNVILHGRNPDKLEKIRLELAAKFPDRKLDVVVLDAAVCFSPDRYVASRNVILEATSNRDVSLLINNVGVGHGLKGDFRAMTDQTSTTIDVLLDTNIRFMTHLTQIMLPGLKQCTPSLIINVGSLAELAMPYITVYSATKAYMSTFSKALDNEMRAEGVDVKVECMLFADIDTPVHQMKQSLMVVGSDHAAKCLLDRAGSISTWGSQPVGSPYWFHGFLFWACKVQPWWMLRGGLIKSLTNIKDRGKQD
jgi:17beta-estradiol 17-dehydrogenase / very-long-chain 3-oxoacyl-CoA reductase